MQDTRALEILSDYCAAGYPEEGVTKATFDCSIYDFDDAMCVARDSILSSSRDWHKEFFDFLTSISTASHGKQQYFEQDNGMIYSRISGKYLTLEEAEREYVKELEAW